MGSLRPFFHCHTRQNPLYLARSSTVRTPFHRLRIEPERIPFPGHYLESPVAGRKETMWPYLVGIDCLDRTFLERLSLFETIPVIPGVSLIRSDYGVEALKVALSTVLPDEARFFVVAAHGPLATQNLDLGVI